MALTQLQENFVNEYLIDFNATRAAQRAGYRGSDATLASVGWENLRKPDISEAIQHRLQEKAMLADEVLDRLAAQARSSVGDFFRVGENGDPVFDFRQAATMGKLGLVKKLKIKTRSYQEPYYDISTDDLEQRNVTETNVEFELHDAQAALVHIGKHHKLFADKMDINHSGEVVTRVIEGPKDVR